MALIRRMNYNPFVLDVRERPLSADFSPGEWGLIEANLKVDLSKDPTYVFEQGGFHGCHPDLVGRIDGVLSSGRTPLVFVPGPGEATDCFALKFLKGDDVHVVGADVRDYGNVVLRAELSRRVRAGRRSEDVSK